MARADIEALAEEATRLLESWLYTGVAKLQNGKEVAIDAADESGHLRLAMDLSKRVALKRKMTVNPDELRPKKTAVEATDGQA